MANEDQQQSDMPPVQDTGRNRVLGAFASEGGHLEQALYKDNLRRTAEARMHWDNAKRAASVIAASNSVDPNTGKPFVNPETGQPYTPEDRAKLQAQFEAAMGHYAKIAGTDKAHKGAIAKARGIMEHVMNRGTQQQGGGLPAPPGMQQGQQMLSDARMQATQQNLERQQGVSSEISAQRSVAQAGLDFRKEQADKMVKAGVWKESSPEYSEYVYQIKHPGGAGKPPTPKLYKNKDDEPFMGIPNSEGQIVDVDSGEVVEGAISAPAGEFAEHQWTYADAKGEPHPAFRIGNNMVDAFTKEPLPPGTEVFSAWVAPRTTTTHTPKFVTQPDGSTKFVGYVDTTSVRRPGIPGAPTSAPLPTSSGTPAPATAQGKTPSATSGGPPAAPPPPKTAKKGAAGGGGFRNPRPGDIVGGKVPPGVAKAADTYNASVERRDVMQSALSEALAGNQQAMINILFNHIGMTMGLQKGARMTHDSISEAERSRGMVSGLASKLNYQKDPETGEMVFNWNDPIREGVTLTPQQMQQMVGLANDRVEKDKAAWQREIGYAKVGYGMSGNIPPDVPSAPGKATPSGTAPKTADDYFKKKGIAVPH